MHWENICFVLACRIWYFVCMADYFSPIIENAVRLATYWHKGQLKSDGVFDYISHPFGVSMILNRAGFDDEIVAAGLCHDLLKFTDCPSDEISNATSERVLFIIEPLAYNDKFARKKTWRRKQEIFFEKIHGSNWDTKAVLVAERIHVLHNLIEVLSEFGLPLFDNFFISPEDSLWFDDQLCVMIQDSWTHEIVDEYDKLVNNFVDLLERLDQQSPAFVQNTANSVDKYFFDEPLVQSMSDVNIEDDEEREEEVEQVIENPKLDQDMLRQIASIDEYIKDKKARMVVVDKADELLEEENYTFKHLDNNEALMILPGALKIGIENMTVNSQLFQDKLGLNFMVSFRVLKELKRLHVIKRVDGVKPRKVDVVLAKDILREIEELRK